MKPNQSVITPTKYRTMFTEVSAIVKVLVTISEKTLRSAAVKIKPKVCSKKSLNKYPTTRKIATRNPTIKKPMKI